MSSNKYRDSMQLPFDFDDSIISSAFPEVDEFEHVAKVKVILEVCFSFMCLGS